MKNIGPYVCPCWQLNLEPCESGLRLCAQRVGGTPITRPRMDDKPGPGLNSAKHTKRLYINKTLL